ncbi:uncharacterized protein JCM6883_006013 [Sporobolomyces salmoneus]|uniref:uncharacterized protein n=1 Tax=Sporobolomyces salmoneus TaxID=183962 RepID=UPI0031798EB2
MAVHVDVEPIESPNRIHASTSRSSLEGEGGGGQREVNPVKRTRRNDKVDWLDAVAKDKLYARRSSSTHKGKGREEEAWQVELDVVESNDNGTNRRIKPAVSTADDEESDGEQGIETEDSDDSSLSTAEGIDSFERRTPDKGSDGLRPLPPPAPPPPIPPEIRPSTSSRANVDDPTAAGASPTKVLQPILKRPQNARLHSSTTTSDGQHTLSFSAASLSRTISPTSPSLLNSQLPPQSSLESPPLSSSEPPALLTPPTKDTRRPIFSALDRRSTMGDDKEVGADSRGTSSATHGFDPTATIRSWKSSLTARKNPDKKRLAALGFEEELQRDYDFWASFGISLCNIGGLPGTVLGVLTALQTGGGSMYAIAWPLSGLFMCAVAAILGEMVSTWPVAGAMFTWVFRLSRSIKALDPWARYLSWMTGSFLLCSHILLQIIITWQLAHNLLGVVALFTSKEYSFWVTVAICWGICIFSALVNSSKLSRSPWLWRCGGWFIMSAFIIINVTLLVQSSQVRSATYVFTSYFNATGFESKGYVYMLGWVLTCVATGMEASAHMAEDTIKPSRTVPLAMFWSVAATYLMGWVSICVLLATVDTVGLRPDLQASIALIDNSLPRHYTLLVLVLVLISLVFQNVAQLLATSRFIWALARESALPFSAFFRRLSPKHKQPLPAIWVTILIAVPTLLFLAIDAHIFATTLLEGAGVTVVLSWAIPLIIYLFCPKDVLRGDGRAQWTLRQASRPLAFCAALFCSVFIIMLCLPTGYPVTSLTASYAAAVWVGVSLLSSLAWILYGNSHYAGPIKTTTRWTIGAEVDLPSSTSNPGATRKKSSAHNHATSSAEYGRSAHVFAVSGESEGVETGAWTRDTRDVETGVTGTDSQWTEYTDDGDEEEDEDESERDEESSRGHGRSRNSTGAAHVVKTEAHM